VSFRRDDFDLLYKEYFSELQAVGAIRADLSGWRDTRSDAADLMPDVSITKSRLDRYYLDEGDALGELKTDILRLISAWEERPVYADEVTLAPSVSSANLQVLVALKRRGVKTVLFETPGYAVTMNQASHAGLEVVLLPTYRQASFRCVVPDDIIRNLSPCAFWLTQPRMSLGFDQSFESVATVASGIGEGNFVVVDEATEQRFPAHLRYLTTAAHPNVIRTRGITKGLGLNGLRVACTIHHSAFREEMESTQDVTGISLDYFSLAAAAQLATELPRFMQMLAAANAQTTTLQHRVASLIRGSALQASNLMNGYIGSLFMRIPAAEIYDDVRVRLLRHCRDEGTFVILGSSMRFAFDPSHEFIRVNYFNRERHVLAGVESLLRFSETLVKEKYS
jgi:histidinol-phosphate/aromatic aminotransferase/cobyric acid decarboxylase-like protein